MAALNSPSASLSHAKELLGRAVKLDEAKRYAESLICYEEAIQILIRNMSGQYQGNLPSAFDSRCARAVVCCLVRYI